MKRAPSGVPSTYLPVSEPPASGEYAMSPTLVWRGLHTSARSVSKLVRFSSEYEFCCGGAVGVPVAVRGCELRRQSARQGERERERMCPQPVQGQTWMETGLGSVCFSASWQKLITPNDVSLLRPKARIYVPAITPQRQRPVRTRSHAHA